MKLISAGKVQVVKSADGKSQIYQITSSNTEGNIVQVQGNVGALAQQAQLEASGQVYTGEVFYARPVIAQTKESVSQPIIEEKIVQQPIITRKVVSQPIIKQRVIQTPIIKQKTTDRPVYTEQSLEDAKIQNETVLRQIPVASPGGTVIREKTVQPLIKTIEDQVKILKGDSEVVQKPELVQPVQFNEEIVEKEYQNPSTEIYFQPIYEKQIVNKQEQVNFVPQEDQMLNLKPIANKPVQRDNYREEKIMKPGREIYNQTIVQPVIQREKVDVQFNRQNDKEIVLDAVTEPVQIQQVVRKERVPIPGKEIITQPIVQEYYQ